jgi:hypothetical protein
MTAQGVCVLLRSREGQALESRNSQIVFLCKLAEATTISMLTTNSVAKIFNISAENGRQIRHGGRTKGKKAYKPLNLEVEQEADVFNLIHKCFEAQDSLTERNILNHVEEQIQINRTYG